MNPHFEFKDEASKGEIQMILDNEMVGHISYSRSDKHNVTIEHTVVDPKMKGTGAGKKLIDILVKWARENDQKIQLECTFAKAMFERNPEIQDVLKK